MMNIQSTLRTAPDLCKNVSLAVLLGSNDNSYTVSAQSNTCIYTYFLPNIETGGAKEIQEKKLGQQ
jgi:hypothetical protein